MKVRILGTGRPVVKIAGIAGGVGLHDEEMEAVSRAGFQVAALDTSGDRCDDPAPGPLTWELLASEVHAAIDALGAKRAVLWGTSFGCLVALAAAARRPERVSGLLLCHPPDPYVRPAYQTRILRWAEGRDDQVRATGAAFTLGFRALAGWEAMSPSMLLRIRRLYRTSVEAATPAATLRAKLLLLASEPPGLPPAGAALPATIVAGSWDAVTPLGETRRVLARLPGARMRIIRFAGHGAAFSRPRAFIRIVHEELGRLAAAGGGDAKGG